MKKYINIVASIILTSCSIHKNSFKNENSKVNIAFEKRDDEISSEKSFVSTVGVFVAKQILNLGVNKIGDLLKKEKKKHSASYSATLLKKGFNKENENTLVVTRTIEANEKAMELKIDLEQHQNYFRLIPRSLELKYAKAKITEESCLCKKRDESKVLLAANIKLIAAWENKIGEKQLELLTDTNFSFIKSLDDTIDEEDLKKTFKSDMIKPIPISYVDGVKAPETLLLYVKVKVDEVDGCENEVVKLAEIFIENKSDIVDGVIDLTGLKKGKDEEDN